MAQLAFRERAGVGQRDKRGEIGPSRLRIETGWRGDSTCPGQFTLRRSSPERRAGSAAAAIRVAAQGMRRRRGHGADRQERSRLQGLKSQLATAQWSLLPRSVDAFRFSAMT